jgi:sugar phosphate isomerase/epimerase
MDLSMLLKELWLLRGFAIDFYPRGYYVQKALSLETREQLEKRDLTTRLLDPEEDVVGRLADYIWSEIAAAGEMIAQEFGVSTKTDRFSVPAIATYFPEIASFDEARRRRAAQALMRTVELADKVKARTVEFVVGRTVERCHQPAHDESGNDSGLCEYVYESSPRDRIEKVVEVLKEMVVPLAADKNVRLAAEIEPGFSYVLNSAEQIQDFLAEVKHQGIGSWVGLNIDIGHLIILAETGHSSIRPPTLSLWKDYIFHAHISDNVGLHYRDLVPGSMHPLEKDAKEPSFLDWAGALRELVEDGGPFSGYIAVEMEACDRIQWVQRSVLRLGYIIREIEAHRLTQTSKWPQEVVT